jgi:UDP-N-acetylglucosamine acyltransferase
VIHPSAIVDPSAELAEDVEVGAFSVIGPDVTVGSGTVIGPHVVLQGPLVLGCHNQIYQFASVGAACQDKKYRGEPTTLVIGDHNVIRECVTLQRGTVQDRGETRIGSHGLFMAYSHVAHDCVLGDHVILANSTQLAGHVQVGDHAILGGGTLVHQYCQIGSYAITGAGTVLLQDVPAYIVAQGNPAKPYGINVEALRRAQLSPETIQGLKQAYRTVYRQGLKLHEALAMLALSDDPYVSTFHHSIAVARRGIIR